MLTASESTGFCPHCHIMETDHVAAVCSDIVKRLKEKTYIHKTSSSKQVVICHTGWQSYYSHSPIKMRLYISTSWLNSSSFKMQLFQREWREQIETVQLRTTHGNSLYHSQPMRTFQQKTIAALVLQSGRARRSRRNTTHSHIYGKWMWIKPRLSF